VIDQLELLLLIRSTEQVDAIENLIVNSLSTFVLKDGAIVGLDNTVQGNARLRGMTLPTGSA
jgi:hypothetical protein